MEFNAKIINLEKQYNSCVIISVFEIRHLSSIAEKIDRISKGYISTLLCRGELEGKIGQTLLLYHVPNILFERVLLIGCGKEHELNEYKYKQIIFKAMNILNNTGSTEAVCFLNDLNINGHTIYWKIRQAVENIQDSLYTFNQFKSRKKESHTLLRKMIFNVFTIEELTIGEHAIQHGLAISTGVKVAKDLGNMPPNICNSAYLSSQACQLSNINSNIITQIIDEKQMKKLGMNAYLSVGKGSSNESLMSVIEYRGHVNSEERPIVIIGKGLTFDSGGISIKSSDKMDEMKYDMCGASAVYGVMHMVINLHLPLNIIGILACCENMLDRNALRPGDILTTLSGQTVEVLNSDAEGRLVLSDVLTYVERFNPELVIDVATLTGACVIALGHYFTGLISNHNALAYELLNAAKQSEDHAWRFPLIDECKEQLLSNFADIANVGGRSAGVITSGYFLSRFAKKFHWAHLDIAGTAWRSGKNKGATGRPVAMLSQFLLNRSELNSNGNA